MRYKSFTPDMFKPSEEDLRKCGINLEKILCRAEAAAYKKGLAQGRVEGRDEVENEYKQNETYLQLQRDSSAGTQLAVREALATGREEALEAEWKIVRAARKELENEVRRIEKGFQQKSIAPANPNEDRVESSNT